MEFLKFFDGIGLMSGALAEVTKLQISGNQYQKMKALFQKDKDAFYQEVLKEKDFRLWFLYYFSRMAWETYTCYQQKEIDDKIYWDTFFDITLWCENCFQEFGEYGINQYDWFFRHIECRIFRLGRLEFEKMDSVWELEDEISTIKSGEPVINIHIPQGEKLDILPVRASLEQAFQIWRRDKPYLCHSWLLYPGLEEILDEESNILKFQKLFHIVRTDFDEREAEKRIYRKLSDNPAAYPEKTSLQKAAKKYLLKGRKLGNGLGILRT